MVLPLTMATEKTPILPDFYFKFNKINILFYMEQITTIHEKVALAALNMKPSIPIRGSLSNKKRHDEPSYNIFLALAKKIYDESKMSKDESFKYMLCGFIYNHPTMRYRKEQGMNYIEMEDIKLFVELYIEHFENSPHHFKDRESQGAFASACLFKYDFLKLNSL